MGGDQSFVSGVTNKTWGVTNQKYKINMGGDQSETGGDQSYRIIKNGSKCGVMDDDQIFHFETIFESTSTIGSH